MPNGRDHYGACEGCGTLAQLRFSNSPERFSWICLRCRARTGQRLEPAEVDRLQAEQFVSESMLRAASVPASDGAAKSRSEQAPEHTILVIEDDFDTRNAACAILDSAGFSVLQVTNGKEGLALLLRLPVKPCVILLDLWMPVMNGWDFYEYVSKNRELRSIPVIVLTACDLDVNLRSFKWLRKPIGMDTLLEAVRASCAN